MRFVLRGLGGLTLLALGVALAALGALSLMRSIEGREAAAPRAAEERGVAVATAVLERVTAHPVIEAFGEIRSWRTLRVSAQASGRIVALAAQFRDGGRVRAGETLVGIDPADYAARVEDAEVALAEAQADAAEARQSVRSAEVELESAQTQRALRTSTLERQKALAGRGVASASVVDEAELALAAVEQVVASREQAVLTARLRIDRADLAVRRAALTLDEARRRLAETEVVAPFDGLLAEVSATLGDIATANQALASLIDPTALEAAVTLSSAEFSRLLGSDGALMRLPVMVTLALDDQPLSVSGALDRADAATGEGRAGRVVHVRLDLGPDTVLRAGDFVTARINEPPLEGVAVIPAAAATEDGRILIVDGEGRLREAAVRILRRDGDNLIVADAPFGATYVTARAPQLGPGLKVRRSDASAAPGALSAAPGGARG